MEFSTVPLFALTIETKQLLSSLLNPPKIFPSNSELPRDWRGLAHVLGMPGETIPLLASQSDPTDRILGSLQEKSSKKTTFKDLQNALETIERWDVIDDSETLFEKDAQEYFKRLERSQLSAEAIDDNVDAQILTVDDLYRHRAGLEKQTYDAFLLYADKDFEFAKEMIDRLEKEKLKICTKDRDLVAGVSFEHKAIMQLISERCNRLIVIISPDFLKSPANKFFLTYAHAEGIEKRQRKLIPCIYKECKLPPELSYTNKVDYNRKELYDFWGKLCNSVQTSTPLQSKADCQISSTCSNLKNVEKAANEVFTATCDTKFVQKEISSKKNGALKENEKPKEVGSEPDLSKCAKVSTKSHVALSNWVKNKTKKADLQESLEESTEEKVSDSIPSLPSVRSLDEVDLLPTHSDSGKKRKSKFIRTCIKKVQSALKS